MCSLLLYLVIFYFVIHLINLELDIHLVKCFISEKSKGGSLFSTQRLLVVGAVVVVAAVAISLMVNQHLTQENKY